MSLLNRFSVTYNLEKASKKRGYNTSRLSRPTPDPSKPGEALNHAVAEELLDYGYDIHCWMLLLKIHYYQTAEEAWDLLSKDPDTQKYNHVYYTSSKTDVDYCEICHGKEQEHIQNTTRLETKIESVKKERSLREIRNSAINLNKNNEKGRININVNTLNNSKLIASSQNPNSTTNDTSQAHLVHEKLPPLIPSNKLPPPENVHNNLNTNSTRNNNSNTNINLNNDWTAPKKEKAFELGKIEIPKETWEAFEDPNICRICFGNLVNPDNIAQITCGHFFCDVCIKTYLTSKIVNGFVQRIKCLMGGCTKNYVDEEIRANVENTIYVKYKKFLNAQLKLYNPQKTYKNCPFPDCEEIVDCDDAEDEFVQCQWGHVFCYLCFQLERHKKGKCKKENTNLLQQIQKDKKHGINYKQCPKCKVIIEKNEGCNQMQCISCWYSFCWWCLKKYSDDHYALYNVAGCPGMRFETDSGSKWMKNPFWKIFWYLFSCVLGFFAVLLILVFYLIFGCAYEFVKCYTNPKKNDEDEDDDDYDYRYDIERSHHEGNNNNMNNNINNNNQEDEEEPAEKKNIYMICFIGFLGFWCQPLYLMFYVWYGLMECYRRFNCWFYYVDY